MKLTERQMLILKAIVDEHINTATPIGSKQIQKDFLPDISTATIRNEMVVLEKLKLIEKPHTSGGRMPTTLGYKYYSEHISQPKIPNDIKRKLEKVFYQRDLSIDTVIDQSVQIINDSLQLPSVVTSEQHNELLKRFDLVQIDQNNALILVITSSGSINKTEIKLDNNQKQLNDIATCIRIFNDRLIDTKIKDVPAKLETIKSIVRNAVHEYEFCIRQVIEKIFSFHKNQSKTEVFGTKHLIAQPEFRNIENLKQILNILEDTTVWKHIAYIQEKTGKTLITFGDQLGVNRNLAIASTNIKTNSGNKQLSIVGPTRMNYQQIQGLLDFIKANIEEMQK